MTKLQRKKRRPHKAHTAIITQAPDTPEAPYVPKDDLDLFENPMTRAAMAALSEEERASYRAWGEYLFGNIDFEDAKALKNMPPPVYESIAYIISGIKSGLSPDDLDITEQELMENVYGKDWKTKCLYNF